MNELMHIEGMTISVNNQYYYDDYHLKLYVFIFYLFLNFLSLPIKNKLHDAGILPVYYTQASAECVSISAISKGRMRFLKEFKVNGIFP